MVSVLTVCSLFLITSPHSVVKGKYSVEIYLIIDLVKAGGRFCLFLEIFWVSDRQVDIWTYWHRWQVQTGSLNILNQQNHPSIQNQSEATFRFIRLKVRKIIRFVQCPEDLFCLRNVFKDDRNIFFEGMAQIFPSKMAQLFSLKTDKIFIADNKNCIYWSGKSEVVLWCDNGSVTSIIFSTIWSWSDSSWGRERGCQQIQQSSENLK